MTDPQQPDGSTSQPGLRVGVVGATGQVGAVMLRLLAERGLPIAELRAFASARSAGKTVSFAGRVDELTLERWIVENEDLVGEPLLILGNQLAEFEEDKDRLDILALDLSGEIVLVELKVSEEFRVTDLQALAYAGAYARRSSKDLARTLQRHLQKQANANAQSAAMVTDGEADPAAPADVVAVSFEEAAAKIAAFIEVDDFGDWQPSQHVRIKLVAPSFPKRVLQTVKWLGDVYSVRLEAITVRL